MSAPWVKRPLTAPLKYPYQALRTAALLAGDRSASIWVMDPPAPAVALAAGHCRRLGVPLVVDIHTVAFYDPKWAALQRLERPLLRCARAVVVTNDNLARRLRAWGAPAFVLPDPLPRSPHDVAEAALGGEVTVIATFSRDEPLDVLPEVAGSLPGVELRVTGAPRGNLSRWPANLRPTGFLSERDYWRQLAGSAAVVVLTTRPDTLLSGGYETMVLGRPLVVSDTGVLRDYFGDAAVYAAPTAASIAAGIGEALSRADELSARIERLAEVREREWRDAADDLRRLVGGAA